VPTNGENWIDAHLGAVAHDLRGPLSVVSGHAQVLRRLTDGKAPVEKIRASAEAILRATNRIAEALEELCREGHDRASAPRETMAVQGLLDEALRGSRSRLVKLEVAPDLPPVAVDRQSFEHRLACLMTALRVGRGEQPITVTVERRQGAVRLTLPDAWLELPIA
jgi:signal transduction histidine kinase